MVSLWKLVVQLHNLAGPIIMLAYPLYSSVTAIESPFKEDDTQWLTYWVLYSFFQLIEIGFDRVLAWIPLWYTFKLVAICWLVLPQFHGAAYVYNNFVKKYVGGPNAGKNEKLSPKQRQLIEQMSPHARASVAAFIEQYGSDAFDRVISTIIEANRKMRSSTSRYSGPASPAQPTRYTGSPIAAQPIRYTGSPTAAQPTRYTGSPTAAQPTRYTGSATESPPGSPTGSPRAAKGLRKADSFREYCRQPVRVLKASLHSLESRRNEIRAKMGTHYVS